MQNALQPSRSKQAASFDTSRSARLGLRSSAAQLAVLRRAAEVAYKSLTDFILDSACVAAEQALLDLLDRPARSNAGLKKLFSQPAPWEQPAAKPLAKQRGKSSDNARA